MTDKLRVIALLKHLGVEFTVQDNLFIKCTEGNAGVGGHPYHEVFFEFDQYDNFVELGAYGK
jgi:hypothetical protein